MNKKHNEQYFTHHFDWSRVPHSDSLTLIVVGLLFSRYLEIRVRRLASVKRSHEKHKVKERAGAIERRRLAKEKGGPEYDAARLARNKKNADERREKYQNDPAYRDEMSRINKERYATDEILREKIKASAKKYAEENREEVLKKSRIRGKEKYAANSVEILAASKAKRDAERAEREKQKAEEIRLEQERFENDPEYRKSKIEQQNKLDAKRLESRRKSQREWDSRNRARRSEERIQFLNSHPEERKKQNAKAMVRYHKNPINAKIQKAKRRAARKGTVIDPKMVAKFYKFVATVETCWCYLCGLLIEDKKDRNIEHIKPLSKGGTHTIDNIASAHGHCNRRKNRKTIAEWNVVKFGQLLLPL